MTPQQNAHISLLLRQRRHADAEAVLRSVLAGDPDNHQALLLSAVALHFQDREMDALPLIDAALRIEPESAHAHAWRARILTCLRRLPEASSVAARAVSLNPRDGFNWNTMALVHMAGREWALVERDARTSLAIDPDDDEAHVLLARALTMQGKADENTGNIAARLAMDPENPTVHCSAGEAALRRGDHKEAAQHFAAALRLDASCRMARDGLIESYRARSVIYRAYLAFAFRLNALSERFGTALMLGIWVVYVIARRFLEGVDPRLATGLMVVYLGFVFWSYVARGLSTLFLLTDRFARMALTSAEKKEALVVGGGFGAGFLLMLAGLAADSRALTTTAGALLAQSIPAALFFSSHSRSGRRLYGFLAVVTWICAVAVIAGTWIPGFPAGFRALAFIIGLVAVSASTLAAVFGVARR